MAGIGVTTMRAGFQPGWRAIGSADCFNPNSIIKACASGEGEPPSAGATAGSNDSVSNKRDSVRNAP